MSSMRSIPIEAGALRRAAGTRWVGQRIEVHDRLGSTMDRASELGAGGSHGTVVIAGEQTRGRGRRGRQWESPPRLGLYMSVLLCPRGNVSDLGSLSPATGLAVRDALTEVCGVPVGLKWPNDVRVSKQKIAGVLTVAEAAGGEVSRIVVGIGVNVLQRRDDFPSSIREDATSIRLVTGAEIDTGCVIASLLASLERTWDRVFSENFGSLVSEWNRACDHIGAEVTHGDEVGRVIGIHHSGGLRLETIDGREVLISSGEI